LQLSEAGGVFIAQLKDKAAYTEVQDKACRAEGEKFLLARQPPKTLKSRFAVEAKVEFT